MLITLIGAKLRTVKGRLRSNQEGSHRAPLFLTISVLFALMLFRSSHWLVTQALELQPIGELLVLKIVSIAFLIFFGILTFSNIVTVCSTLYLADDLDFLMAQPIPSDHLFGSRFIEALVQSSWVIVLFGIPAFAAIGVVMEVHWTYYLMLILVLLPFVAIPTTLATMCVVIITNMLRATRMRDAFMFTGFVAFALLFMSIRLMQPEKMLHRESFEHIGEMIQLLSTPRISLLPSDWAVHVLEPLLFGQKDFDWWSFALLYTTPTALFFISAWMHRFMYMRGYSRVQEGRHGESLLTSLRDWMLHKQRTRGGSIQDHINKLATQPGSFETLRQLIWKDRRTFTRDASQWSNLLVIFALMTIYLVNYRYFQIISNTKIIGDVGLYYVNLAICGFVIVALSGRFLFPLISIEGRSFWLLLQAPISLERILVGKWLGAMLPVAIVGQVLIWTSNLLVLQHWFYLLFASLFILLLSICVAAIAVGMGAIYPQFHNPNAASIAASFGALIFMVSSIVMILVTLLFTFFLVTHTGHMITGVGMIQMTGRHILFFALALLIPICCAGASIKLGAMSLRKRM